MRKRGDADGRTKCHRSVWLSVGVFARMRGVKDPVHESLKINNDSDARGGGAPVILQRPRRRVTPPSAPMTGLSAQAHDRQR